MAIISMWGFVALNVPCFRWNEKEEKEIKENKDRNTLSK